MSTMSVTVEKDPYDLKEKAGNALDKIVRERNGKPLLMLLSGGSSLELLDSIKDTSIDAGITFGMLDDRFDQDPDVNSFQIVSRSGFYLRALRRGAVFFDSSVSELEDLDAYARRYEQYIKKWLKQNPQGIIRATIGIGPDGHTSGILPQPEDPKKFNDLFNSEKLIVGYDIGNGGKQGPKNLHRYRMTSTFTLMRMFDKALTYMKGQSKKEALEKVMAKEGDVAATPGRIIHELKKVELFTDIDTQQ